MIIRLNYSSWGQQVANLTNFIFHGKFSSIKIRKNWAKSKDRCANIWYVHVWMNETQSIYKYKYINRNFLWLLLKLNFDNPII